MAMLVVGARVWIMLGGRGGGGVAGRGRGRGCLQLASLLFTTSSLMVLNEIAWGRLRSGFASSALLLMVGGVGVQRRDWLMRRRAAAAAAAVKPILGESQRTVRRREAERRGPRRCCRGDSGCSASQVLLVALCAVTLHLVAPFYQSARYIACWLWEEKWALQWKCYLLHATGMCVQEVWWLC